ncbi:S-locus lectin protein kinase family protein, putative isoform 2 [Hibiscus syriacus]|uniref:S-locus lectin protein kinase family protein, putative isoform 2 n=1 Tax=Hibiscus syriacus TaxID=106335 RepID=A0A6A2Z705_HIBSY|nr:S-locus lectin protein kinase family protein, putative isoform 2 [Hibiscus syriacus]
MKAASSWSVPNIVSSILFINTILILFSSPQFCFARDNITEKSRLADGETLVSAGNRFELGFFSPSSISNVKRYVGIWYISNPKILVWVANGKNPVPDKTGVLSVADGTLKLSDDKGNLYWSAQPGVKRSTPVVKLSDTGNLILLDRSKIYLWQSFEHPTDTFLYGMKMNADILLTSWRSEDDPSPGNFTFRLDPQSRPVVMEKSTIYWRSGRADELPSTLVNFWNFSQSKTQDYQDKRMVLNSTGHLQYWELDADMKSWNLIWWEPNNNCSMFNFCGNFGTCNFKSWLPCKFLPGFKPKFLEKWNAGDFSDGCTRNSSSSCGNDFVSLKRMKVDDSYSPITVNDETTCREECLKDCQCQAYAFVGQRDSTISCLIWSDDLKNLQEDQDGGYDLKLRVALSDIEATTRNCGTCGTNLIPYPLSTGPECGDLMYFSFDCNNDTDELSFTAPNGNYSVITVNPDARTFVIQMKAKEADNCSAMHSSATRILQFNQSSPFNVTGNCRGSVGNLTSDSSLEDTVEVEISWKPPLEPICTSSADCKDWPHSTCNETGNGLRRCLCNTTFRWDGSALNCTQG